ncbi:MAG: hypothetical protein IT565_09325, partial [Rhodospirillales bacterium]|nr:hypothetical protein [Rhodospirillales bacterium]
MNIRVLLGLAVVSLLLPAVALAGGGRKVADSVPANAAPLRITETGRWTHKHRPAEVNPAS